MQNNKKNRSGLLATGGTVSGVFAVIGASCCILPIILVNLGLSSALVSHLGVVAQLRPWFMGLTLLLVAGGFFFAFRGAQRPSRKTIGGLIFATALAVGAIILPYYEGDIQRWLNL
ncbi:MAG: mercuric transporter MerT family protein [Litorimonas sp.]